MPPSAAADGQKTDFYNGAMVLFIFSSAFLFSRKSSFLVVIIASPAPPPFLASLSYCSFCAPWKMVVGRSPQKSIIAATTVKLSANSPKNCVWLDRKVDFFQCYSIFAFDKQISLD